jgi:hypothetical protein
MKHIFNKDNNDNLINLCKKTNVTLVRAPYKGAISLV